MIERSTIRALARHMREKHSADSIDDTVSRIMSASTVVVTRRHLRNQGAYDDWLVSIKVSNDAFVLGTDQYEVSGTWCKEVAAKVEDIENEIKDAIREL